MVASARRFLRVRVLNQPVEELSQRLADYLAETILSVVALPRLRVLGNTPNTNPGWILNR
jgi:hypothetical protein